MSNVQAIDGLLLREMVLSGAALLEKNREAVDALNVFPVPDGDTGTNMSLTMASATREINQKEFARADEAAEALAKGALRGARGNSGVITSQLYRGFSRALAGLEKITPVDFARALKAGADTAYKAVMKPKEGTILTVARVIAEDAMRQAQAAPEDFDALFDVILTSGESILKRTPEMLPVLKQAGVVDAGGRGLLLIYTGYAAALRGEKVENVQVEAGGVPAENEFEDDHDSLEDIKFAYCTEFLIQRLKETAQESDIDTFRRQLNRIGDCVLVVGDLSLVKVHVHTNDPGKALQYGLELGELVNLKIENMVEQRRENLRQKEEKAKKEPPKPFGMVSVSVNAETVFVFPNNGKIILAAQQAAEISNKNVRVVPTKNVAMGIAAAVAFQPDLSADENAQRMEEAAQRVRTGTVTYAVRNSDFEDMHISEGDVIGLHNGKVEFKGQSRREVALDLMRAIVTDDDELITIYYGADTQEEEAQALGKEMEALFPDCDVEVHSGGQPLYYYLISVE